MAVLIGALLALLVVGVVLYPFVSRRLGFAGPPGNGYREAAGPPAWRLRREEIYESIRSLRLEYELGGVEEADYGERLRAYRVQAAAVVRDQALAEQEVERLVEREVLALRDAAPPGPEALRPGPEALMEDGATEHSRPERPTEVPVAAEVEGDDGAAR
jgi:hypothetical protein